MVAVSSMGAYHRNPHSHVNFFDMILPPQAIPLLLLLLLVAPLALLAGESLFIPLLEWSKSLFMPGTQAVFTTLPIHFFIKLGAFLILVFFSLVQMLFRIKTIYCDVWARSFGRPDPLHVDYNTDLQQSMISLLQWHLYRLLIVAVPPLGMMLLTVIVGFVGLTLLNVFIDLPAATLPVFFISGIFLMMVLSLLSGFAVLNGFWTAFTSMFGDVIAMTEPDLPSKVIYDRARRLTFVAPSWAVLYTFYFVYWLFIVGECVWLLSTYDIQDIIQLQANMPLILMLDILTVVGFVGLTYFKFSVYHNALVRYYHRLPAQFRERFSPPPSLHQLRQSLEAESGTSYF